MSEAKANRPAGKLRLILPVILRITSSLVLWTLGSAPMILIEAQTGKDRLIREMPQSKRATSSTKQTKHSSSVLTRRAALTKPLGTPEEEMK